MGGCPVPLGRAGGVTVFGEAPGLLELLAPPGFGARIVRPHGLSFGGRLGRSAERLLHVARVLLRQRIRVLLEQRDHIAVRNAGTAAEPALHRLGQSKRDRVGEAVVLRPLWERGCPRNRLPCLEEFVSKGGERERCLDETAAGLVNVLLGGREELLAVFLDELAAPLEGFIDPRWQASTRSLRASRSRRRSGSLGVGLAPRDPAPSQPASSRASSSGAATSAPSAALS
jgi:hypothetical protein